MCDVCSAPGATIWCHLQNRSSLTGFDVLHVLAMLCSLVLVWLTGLRWIAYCLAVFPVGVVIFAIALRVAPYLIHPTLVLRRQDSSFVTLDLK